MMTELQNNFELIKDRMVAKYMGEKEYLFFYPPCIIPAWEPLIDEMIELVEQHNQMKPNDTVRFFQVKEKFGVLTVYLEWLDAGKRASDNPIDEELYEKIKVISGRGHKICRLCGRDKVETVHESRVDWRCMEHYDGDGFGWRVR